MNTQQTKEVQPHQWTHTGTEVLILRRTGHDRKSHSGFTYPAGVESVATAPDWNNEKKCGGGLHGWPWAFGLGEGQDFEPNDLWIVLGAKPEDVVGELEGGWKCKCKTAVIRFEGNMKGAMDFLREGFTACVKNLAAGYSATNASSGNSAKNASSGDYATNASSGNSATNASSGNSATNASSGYSATNASSGDYATNASSGNSAKNASSGNSAKNASSGDYAKNASSGYSATNASSGNSATNAAEGKDSTCACAGYNGAVKVGERGAFAIAYWDETTGPHFLTGKVGENGIKANTWYRVEDGKISEVK